MIVTNVEGGWEIVYQPAHGLLAGKLAEHFSEDRRCEFWLETKTAIFGHDDNKVAFRSGERTYITDVGAPKDFTLVSMTSKQRFKEVRDRIENAYRKHRWIGLLESRHAAFIYADNTTSKSLRTLLTDEQSRRTSVLRSLKRKQRDLEQAYEVMRWSDRCSLILCQSRIPEMNRRLEVITFRDGTRSDISRRENGSLMVEPWPFSVDEFSVATEVHLLSQLSFGDDAELRAALDSADVEDRVWRFER